MSDFASALYEGRVVHRRLRPVAHRLEYRVFSALIDLDELPALDAAFNRFSRGRANLFSFHDADYGVGAPADLAAHIRESLRERGVDAAGPIRLLCYPRMLGYAFNPLAVYFCHGGDGGLSAVLYEVTSTFRERHAYLAPIEAADASALRHAADKRLHVSPFMDMDARYDFYVRPPADEVVVAIRQSDGEGALLNAVFAGRRVPLSDRALVGAFARHPLMTLKVIAAIHWEAAKLLAKGLRLRAGPPAPAEPISLARADAGRRP